jgi:anti-sigma factor RsiW
LGVYVSNQLKTMKCKQAESLLSAHGDAELTGQLQGALSEHLSGCPACSKQLAELRSDRELLLAVPPPAPVAFMATRVMAEIRAGHARRRRFALNRALGTIVAALVIAVSAGVGTVIGSGLAQQNDSTAQSSLLEVSSNDPVVEMAQSAIGGE